MSNRSDFNMIEEILHMYILIMNISIVSFDAVEHQAFLVNIPVFDLTT